MDLLKKEMEKKKKALELAKQKQQDSSRFLRAAELRRVEEEQQEEEQRKKRSRSRISKIETTQNEHPTGGNDDAVPEEKRPRTDKKGRDESKEVSREEKEPVVDTITQKQEKLSPSDVSKRLRELGLPVRLFGERTIRKSSKEYDDSQRLERLSKAMEERRHAMAGLSEMDEFRLGRGHGIRNPFLGGRKGDAEETTSREAAALQSPDKVAKTGSDHVEKADDKEHRDDSDDPHKRIHRFFKGLLRQWEDDLALRPESVKRTAAGKNETKTLKQCKDYIRPLFKLCKTRRLEPSLMANILKIVDYCEQGEFVKANDAYIDVAIGRAAWPIGVTMVGIHARSGRAKIESSNVAHVMNSELQRKYLTSVKRLMSYYQKKREDVAPSKKVMY